MKFSSHPLPPTSTALHVIDEASAPCYFANGDPAKGYHTCDVKSPVSSCCPPGYTCSSNELCVLISPTSLEQPAPGTVSRGACTEPRWNGNSCGGNCLGETTCQPLAVFPPPPASDSASPCPVRRRGVEVHSRF